jgi:hypothetical protein
VASGDATADKAGLAVKPLKAAAPIRLASCLRVMSIVCLGQDVAATLDL